MQGAIAVVVVLGALIFFHELGHFIAARLLGVGVTTFSLGFGPKLASFVRGGTEYRLSAIPLGGYVAMVGERPDEELPEEFDESVSFQHRPAWQRTLVVAAGPVFNFLLAWLIYFGLLLVQGQFILKPIVGQVMDDSPAMHAGLHTGDEITAVDAAPIGAWDEMVERIVGSNGSPMVFTVRRDGALLELTVTPEIRTRQNIFGEEISVPMVGIGPKGEIMVLEQSTGQAIVGGFQDTWRGVSLMAQSVVKLVTGAVPLDQVGGPIMIAQLVSEQTKEGLANLLYLTAFISVNLGFLNLLPIPVLDGGHILFNFMEMVMRRPVPDRIQAVTMRIGMALLVGLMILATYNDIHRWFTS